MQQLSKVVIVYTSCFILLTKINRLDILYELFGEVTTTIEVSNEFGRPSPDWVPVETLKDNPQRISLEAELDKGEASTVALAIQKTNSLLVLDDHKARRIAAKLKLQFTGTLGVLLKAKEAGK